MIPEFPESKKLELSDKAIIEKFTKQFPPYSDFNFTSLWCWDTQSMAELAQLNNNLIIQFNDYLTGTPFYTFIGNDEINNTVNTLLIYQAKHSMPIRLKLIPEQMVIGIDNESYLIKEDRDNFDYIYSIQDLYQFHGSKFEMHRNLFNRFVRRYANIEVRSLPILSMQKDIISFNNAWRKNKQTLENHDELLNESKSISRLFDIKQDNIIATCIFRDGMLIAFAINELLKGDYAICHFAKANAQFAGVYSYLMKSNCGLLLSLGRTLLNYEQDLGLSNLRYAKITFRPVSFLKKYIIEPKNVLIATVHIKHKEKSF